MTIDRAALRRLWDTPGQRQRDDLIKLHDAIPGLLDELDAKDRRIAELESTLRTALTGWRTNHLCEVEYSDEELARIDELQKLVESEEI